MRCGAACARPKSARTRCSAKSCATRCGSALRANELYLQAASKRGAASRRRSRRPTRWSASSRSSRRTTLGAPPWRAPARAPVQRSSPVALPGLPFQRLVRRACRRCRGRCLSVTSSQARPRPRPRPRLRKFPRLCLCLCLHLLPASWLRQRPTKVRLPHRVPAAHLQALLSPRLDSRSLRLPRSTSRTFAISYRRLALSSRCG